DSNVTVIDSADPGNSGAGAVSGSPISVGANPVSAAVNPTTGRVYITNGGENTISVLGPTFHVTLNGATITKAARGSTVQVAWGALFGTNAGDRVGLFPAGAANNASPASAI